MENYIVQGKNKLIKSNLLANPLKKFRKKTRACSQIPKHKSQKMFCKISKKENIAQIPKISCRITTNPMGKFKSSNVLGISGQNCVINDTPFDHITKQNFKQAVREIGSLASRHPGQVTFHRTKKGPESSDRGRNLNLYIKKALSQTKFRTRSREHKRNCSRINAESLNSISRNNSKRMYISADKEQASTCDAPRVRVMKQVDENQFDFPQNSLPLISKIYDFNPDEPTYSKCLLDVETYNKIVGRVPRSRISPSLKYSTENPGHKEAISSDLYSIGSLYSSKNLQTGIAWENGFSTENFRDMPSPGGRSHYGSKEIGLNQADNLRIEENGFYSQENSLSRNEKEFQKIKEKIVNNALFPRKYLKALKKSEIATIRGSEHTPPRMNRNKSLDLAGRKFKIYEDALIMLRSIQAAQVTSSTCTKQKQERSCSPYIKEKMLKFSRNRAGLKSSKTTNQTGSPQAISLDPHAHIFSLEGNETIELLHEQESAIIKNSVDSYKD
ncbi:unnamed protein product [Moneuplotes crassus]|uniref:Uncharacterized protein n=1 Tax=Euplotes crassus TaxID=5936 RepID=A0AAD2D843_EUPCR|nr:unnamed protein product [Moneuplotes crassus]